MCDWKKILMGGLAGAMVLPLVFFLVTLLLAPFFPLNPYTIPGARSLSQPEAILFVAYPLLLSFIAAFAYDYLRPVLPKRPAPHVLVFAGLLFLVETVPMLFLIYTNFNYPAGFFPHQVVRNAVGFSVLGFLFFYVWKK